MKNSIFLGVIGTVFSVSVFAGEIVMDFTALKEVPKNIQPYGAGKPTLSIVDADGKKAIQSKVPCAAEGRSYGGMVIYLKDRIPWDDFDVIQVTVFQLDESVKRLTCVVYDEFNHVWQTSVPTGFDENYTFRKDALKYTYTEGKNKAPKPDAKTGKVKMVIFSMNLSKGVPKDFFLTVSKVMFKEGQK